MANEQRQEAFALTTSRGFESWLERSACTLAFTTYQAGKLMLVGLGENGRLSIFERSFSRCMGLGVSADSRTLLLASQNQIIRFDDNLPAGDRHGIHDAIYSPRLSWITGDLDVHDMAFDVASRPIFVNTRFSCLATTSEGWSFKPLWKPAFISKLAPEDRCHLNGLAMGDGHPRFVTAVSRSNIADGWRDRRSDGGIVIDVASNTIVCDGLSMPHSPRLHAGRLWLLNSGCAEFGWVDTNTGGFHPVALCPGYARGLAFVGEHAVIGLSLARERSSFDGLPMQRILEAQDTQPRCGFLVIDTRTGDTVAWARIEGVVRELYDVALLPGVRNPALIGFKGEEIAHMVSIDEP